MACITDGVVHELQRRGSEYISEKGAGSSIFDYSRVEVEGSVTRCEMLGYSAGGVGCRDDLISKY
jgi:hypothetical protein